MLKTLLVCSLLVAGCQSEQIRPVVDAVAPVLVEVFVPPQVKFWVWIVLAVLGGGGVGGGIGGVIGRKTKK